MLRRLALDPTDFAGCARTPTASDLTRTSSRLTRTSPWKRAGQPESGRSARELQRSVLERGRIARARGRSEPEFGIDVAIDGALSDHVGGEQLHCFLRLEEADLSERPSQELRETPDAQRGPKLLGGPLTGEADFQFSGNGKADRCRDGDAVRLLEVPATGAVLGGRVESGVVLAHRPVAWRRVFRIDALSGVTSSCHRCRTCRRTANRSRRDDPGSPRRRGTDEAPPSPS